MEFNGGWSDYVCSPQCPGGGEDTRYGIEGGEGGGGGGGGAWVAVGRLEPMFSVQERIFETDKEGLISESFYLNLCRCLKRFFNFYSEAFAFPKSQFFLSVIKHAGLYGRLKTCRFIWKTENMHVYMED